MENASKALIIAGAILLSILLISLGIVIFNQAKDVVSGSGMTKAELQSFNSQFTQYEGTQKGSAIRSMVQEVMANNNSSEASDETMVAITGVVKLDAKASATPEYGSLKNTKTYQVKPVYTKGRVSELQVSASSDQQNP